MVSTGTIYRKSKLAMSLKYILNKLRTILKSPSVHFFVMLVILLTYIMWYVGYEIIGFNSAAVSKKIMIANALFILFPFWGLKPKHRKYAWIPIILIGVWALMQLWYARSYNDIMPISSYFMFNNVNSLLINSTIASMRFNDFMIIIPTIICYLIYRLTIKDKLEKQKQKNSILMSVGILLFSIILFFGQVCVLSYNIRESQDIKEIIATAKDYITTLFGNIDYFVLHGLIPHTILSSKTYFFKSDIELKAEDILQMKSFFHENNVPKINKVEKNQSKNVIYIIIESWNSWTLDTKVRDREVTPVINKLTQQENVIFSKNVVTQVSNGHSSDGHFIYNTGLIPLTNDAISISYNDCSYPSLVKSLNFTTSINIVCDRQSFWHQNKTSKCYGFNLVYDCDSISTDNTIENNIDDKLLFDFAKKKLPKLKQPFYAQLVTLTMHHPYNVLKVPPTWISESNEFTFEIRNYLEATHFMDMQLGLFIDFLKKEDLYDNSIIIIASDHNDVSMTEGLSSTDVMIPFLILNADTTLHYDNIMGQIDIFPTILDVTGYNSSNWRGLGNSILRKPEVNSAVNKNGDVIGDTSNILVSRQKQAWDISEKLIKNRFFDKNNVNSLYD